MESARTASVSDAKYLISAYNQCIAEQENFRGASTFHAREAIADPEQEIPTFIGSDDRCAFVGEIDSVPVGFALVHTETLADSSTHVMIDAIYVEPDARRVWVGDALTAQIRDYGRSKGASTIDAYALPGDRDTKNFFEGSGLVARLIIMSQKLD